MAIPFYNQADQDIWESGNKFIPQEQYRLGNTAPIANAASNTGIINTQAAGSYMGYPSYEAWLLAQGAQGGGGGGGGGGGPDIIEEDRFSMGMSPGAMGGKLPGVGNWAKRTFGPLAHAYSQLPTPTNLLRRGWKGIQKWRGDRKIEKEQNLQEEIRAHNEAAGEKARVATVAQQIQQNIDRGGRGDRPDTGRNRPGGGPGQSPTGGNVAGTPFAQGGRIGYADRGFVEDINVEGPGFDVNENIEMAEADPFHMRIQELMDKGLSWEDAYDIAAQEFQDEFTEAPEESFSDQGIASLV